MNAHSHARYEALLKVTGQARFEGEIAPAGLLHAALIEAPIACGEPQYAATAFSNSDNFGPRMNR